MKNESDEMMCNQRGWKPEKKEKSGARRPTNYTVEIRHFNEPISLFLPPVHHVFRGSGETYSTGPPGRAPVMLSERLLKPPEYKTGENRENVILGLMLLNPLKTTGMEDLKTKQTTDLKINRLKTNKNKIQFFTNVKFLQIMKKQILILAFFVLALLAGTSKSFGQLLPSNIGPQTGTCTSDPLHPKAGQSYTYTVTNDNGVVPTGYTWWITKNPQFVVPATGGADQSGKLIATTGQLIATTATGGTNEGASIDITWSPEIIAATEYQGDPTNWGTASATNKTPTFVAVMANGDCNNNLQVYEINPSPSFTVDITNIDITEATDKTKPYGEDVEQCADIVRNASYSSGKEITMDYGTNTLYFEVISANFVTNWKPTFQIDGLLGDQTADISWYATLADAQAGNNAIDTHAGQADGAVVGGTTATALTTSEDNTADGVSVYVKVVVHNNKYENILATNNPITLTVDGQDATGQWDLVNSDCSDPGNADQADASTQTITARPNINNAITPAPSTAPDTFIPKN